MLERKRPAAFIAERESDLMRWGREFGIEIQRASKADENEALTELWDAVERGVQKGVGSAVAEQLQRFADLLGYVVAAEVQDIRYVLNQNRQRLCGTNVV